MVSLGFFRLGGLGTSGWDRWTGILALFRYQMPHLFVSKVLCEKSSKSFFALSGLRMSSCLRVQRHAGRVVRVVRGLSGFLGSSWAVRRFGV